MKIKEKSKNVKKKAFWIFLAFSFFLISPEVIAQGQAINSNEIIIEFVSEFSPTLTPGPTATGTSGPTNTPTQAPNWCMSQGGVCCQSTGAFPCSGDRLQHSSGDAKCDGCWRSSGTFWCCSGGCGYGTPQPFVTPIAGCALPTATQPPGGPTATATQPPSGPTSTLAPTLTPEPTTPYPTATGVPGEILYLKANFQGFSSGDEEEFGVTLKAKDTDYATSLILPADGKSEAIGLEDLEVGETYDLVLSSWGFLSVKKSLTVRDGRNPASGYFDFGTLRTGDLNGDNQINGLDWSLMKLNFGESGEE